MFGLGQVVATRGAVATGVNLLGLIWRHQREDWGDLDAEDKRLNYQALQLGGRLLSKYVVGEHHFYVITEQDRSVTTILLTDEY